MRPSGGVLSISHLPPLSGAYTRSQTHCKAIACSQDSKPAIEIEKAVFNPTTLDSRLTETGPRTQTRVSVPDTPSRFLAKPFVRQRGAGRHKCFATLQLAECRSITGEVPVDPRIVQSLSHHAR